ncbi:MAG: alpha/beta hydrolase [Anaerolineales bacterium]|jgi:pimeloyl-ACP methyl ester carboxylesterase
MDNPKISKYYRDVPADLVKSLLDFRQRYPYQSRTIQGYEWRFIDTGEGKEVLFVMAGGTSITEVSYQSLSHFAEKSRVISPDYPPIRDIDTFFAGAIALLDELGVGQFSLMGGSYGGWMAQSFVRAYPERVRKLVLTAIGPPNAENSRQIAKMLGWLRLTPTFVLKMLINYSFSRLDTSLTDEYPEMALLWALVKEVMGTRVRREDIFALLYRLIDQTENYNFLPDDLKDWEGSILIVCGSEDPSTPTDKREALRTLYPQAEMKIFEGGGHGIALTHQQAYFAAIDEFLMR